MPRPAPLGAVPKGAPVQLAPSPESIRSALQSLASNPDLSEEEVRKLLGQLHTFSWSIQEEKRPGDPESKYWAELSEDDPAAQRMEAVWRDTLWIAVSERPDGSLTAVSRVSGLDIKQHPYCSHTGKKHPEIPSDFMKYRRTPKLPEQVRNLICQYHIGDLVKILRNNHSNREVVIFITMVMCDVTSPKVIKADNKEPLHAAGVIPVLCDLLQEHKIVEVIAQNICAVIRNQLTHQASMEQFEKEERFPLLLEFLNTYPMNNELVHRAVGCLLMYTSRGNSARKKMFDAQVVPCVVKILQTPHGRLHQIRRLIVTIFQKIVKAVDKDAFTQALDAVKGFTLLNHLRGVTHDDDYDAIRDLLTLRPDLPRGTLVDPTVLVIDDQGVFHREAIMQIMKANEERHYEEDPPTPKAARLAFNDQEAGSPLFPSQPSFGAGDFIDSEDDEPARVSPSKEKSRTPGKQAPQSSLPDVVMADDYFLDGPLSTSSAITTPSTLHWMGDMLKEKMSPDDGEQREVAFAAMPTEEQRQARNLIDLLNKSFTPDGTFPRDKDFVQKLYSMLDIVASKCGEILRKGPIGIVDVPSPCYVFGDIHGNFADLQYYMKELSVFGDILYASHPFLFLGDYVDRGKYGPECIAYLLAHKLVSPDSIILLRGNHEDNDVCGDTATYGEGCFKTQMLRLFGSLGYQPAQQLYDRVVDTFNYFPLAAVIENKIFASHGGIPRYMGGEDLRYQTLRDPDFKPFTAFILPPPEQLTTSKLAQDALMRQWVYAHDLIWSDPSGTGDRLDEYGFGRSCRGGQVLSYGQPAVDGFLDHCGLEFIIRGHEEKADGLNISKQARVLTVFTTSDYCQKGNKGGVALVRKQPNGDLLCRMIHRAKPAGLKSPYVY